MSPKDPDDNSPPAVSLMSHEVNTVTPDTCVASAWRLSTKRHIACFLVVENGTLTGIVTRTDLYAARVSGLIRDRMSAPVFCIGPANTVEQALDIMEEHGFDFLPIIDGTIFLGIVSRDVLEGNEPDKTPWPKAPKPN